MKHERSCGTIPFTLKGGKRFYLLVSPAGRESYGFPKGHMEAGESELATAIRETEEETSLKVTPIEAFHRTVEYSPKHGVMKRVDYFLASYSGNPHHKMGFEHMSYRVLPFEGALQCLAHQQHVEILREAEAFLCAEGV